MPSDLRWSKKSTGPLAPPREAGATVPEPRCGGLERWFLRLRTFVDGHIGVVGGRLGNGRPRCHLVFSTTVDVLWTSPDQEERAE